MSDARPSNQLDSLRGLGVAGVVWFHWFPEQFAALEIVLDLQLFFVLSGFLLTRILLQARDAWEDGSLNSRGTIVRLFYLRRALRILPVFYLTLAVLAWFDIGGAGKSWPWHAAFLSNYAVMASGEYTELGHFWSLGVSEQFYLLWPLIVLFPPRSWVPKLFIGATVVAVVYRLIGQLFFPELVMWDLATPGSLDSMGLGALLGFHRHYATPAYAWWLRFRSRVALVAFGLLVLRVVFKAKLPVVYLDDLWLSVLFTAFISVVADGVGGVGGRVLDVKPLRYLGRISYAVYLFHIPTGPLVTFLINLAPELWQVPHLWHWGMALCTLLLAVLARHLVEEPVNSLKRRFAYHPPVARAAGAPLTVPAATR